MLGTANKLKTARNIKLQGAVSGNVNFDGTANVTINTTQANIAVIAGDILMQWGKGTEIINFPANYNKNNCVVISASSKHVTSTSLVYGVHDEHQFMSVELDEKIHIEVTSYSENNMPGGTYPYKIVLMKIA